MRRRDFISTLLLTSCIDNTPTPKMNAAQIIHYYYSATGGAEEEVIDEEYRNASGQTLWWGIGDSTMISNNSTGAGTNPAAGIAQYWTGSAFADIPVTDIPGAANGTIWGPFAAAHYARTGNKVAVVSSSIGGTKFFNTWNGSSAAYLAAETEALEAMVAGGFSKIRVVLSCGINDGTAGDTIATVNTNIGALIDRINLTFDSPEIYIFMFGVSSSGGTRFPQIRGYKREWAILHDNVKIALQLAPYNNWGLYSADGIHLSREGQDFLAEHFDRFLDLDQTANKWANFIIGSHYSVLTTTQKNAIYTFIDEMMVGDRWHNCLSFWHGENLPHENDFFVDWGGLNILIDESYQYVNGIVTTNTNESFRMQVSVQNNTYRWSKTNMSIGARIKDRKSAVGGSTRYLMGVSSGSNVIGIEETSAGAIRGYLHDLSTGLILAANGGFIDNNSYSIGRTGTDKFGYINGAEVDTETGVTALTDLTNGIQVGGRYTAGATLFLNCEYRYTWIATHDATFHSQIYAAGTNLIANFV